MAPVTTSPTDTPKRLSDVELIAKLREQVEAWSDDAGSEFQFPDVMRQAADAIERLSAPPSQGKVERAREMYRANYEEVCSKDTRQWPSREHLFQLCEDAAIAAITQALTESSGQDGALVKRTRDMLSFYLNRPGVDHEKRTPLTTEITDRECLEIANVLRDCARAIERLSARALPLPVSADGAK